MTTHLALPGPSTIDPHRPEPPRRLSRGSRQLLPMVGRRLLVGITYTRPDGSVSSAEQFCGQVLDVADGVVVVERPGAPEPAVLPAEVEAYRPAAVGRYTLQCTGEVIRDPDFVTTWQVAVAPASPRPQEAPGPARKPSATATTSNGSMPTGGLPISAVPGAVGASRRI